MYQGVLCDLSGVLFVGDRALPGAVEDLFSLRAAGIPVRFVTNVTRQSREGLLGRLSDLGLEIDADDLFTPAQAARGYVRERGLSPYILVHPMLQPELADLVSPRPDAVLLGDAGHAFSYESLNTAFRVLIEERGAPLLAMGTNRYFRAADGLSLDIGPFVHALEYAAEAEAVVLGKPARAFFLQAVDSMGLAPEEVVMIGDDWKVDVEGAMAAGLGGILVRTGKYRPGDEERIGIPGAQACDDLGAAVDLIL